VDRVKKLSTGEKKMLTNARQILISEIVLVQDLREDIVEGILEETV
ncbi:MAG: CarD family transcriptional regulator, partial [Anaerovoracaceae bacterium]